MNLYSVVALFLLIELILGLFKTHYAVLVLLFIALLIPCGAIKYNIGVNLNSFNLAVFIAFVVTFRSFRKETLWETLPNSYYWFAGVSLLFSLIASIGTFSIGEIVQNYILFSLEYYLIGLVLCYTDITKKNINQFSVVLFIISIIIISYGFFNFVIKFNPYIAYLSQLTGVEDYSNEFALEDRGILDGRVSSVFTHPLQLGQCMMLFFTYMYYELKNRIPFVLYVVYLSLIVICCFLTGSRSAMLPVLLIPVIHLLYVEKEKRIRYFLLGSIAFFSLYPALPEESRDSFESVVFFWDDEKSESAGVKGSSTDGRLYQFTEALDIISDDPLFGKGLGYIKNFGEKHNEMYGYESIFLWQLVEDGILGLMVFLLFYYSLYRYMLSKCKTPLDKARTHSLCLPYFISICLTGVTYSFYAIFLVFYFYILNSINCSEPSEIEKSEVSS